jgi:hypothetical protein
MNVEIGTESGQFPEKEYINGIFLAVRYIIQHSVKENTCTSLLSCVSHIISLFLYFILQ